jgi:FkbM family methyltransferase
MLLATYRKLRSLLMHPMTREHRAEALLRTARWMVQKRLASGPTRVGWVNESTLLVDSREPGSGACPCFGLYEYEFMGFALHFLRPQDLFLDVGAHVGVYTILASVAVGCRSIACEPAPDALRLLQENLALNRIGTHVELWPNAIGAASGTASITTLLGSRNHLVGVAAARQEACVPVQMATVDEVVGGRPVQLIKVDVEGGEAQVIAGAAKTLGHEALLALIVELNGSGGSSEREVRRTIVDAGFDACLYDPRRRTLEPLGEALSPLGNTIFVRRAAVDEVAARLKAAPPARIFGRLL